MKKYLPFLVLAGLFLIPAVSHADTYCEGYNSYCSAAIVYKSDTCEYYVLEYNYNQFALVSWMGGNILNSYSYFYGPWSSLSMQTVFNTSQYGWPSSKIYIAASMIPQSDLVQRYYSYCPEG
jgi:hypothetical protein